MLVIFFSFCVCVSGNTFFLNLLYLCMASFVLRTNLIILNAHDKISGYCHGLVTDLEVKEKENDLK